MGYRVSTPPVTFLVLALPYGLGFGFCGLWVPFALTRAGFPLSLTASIVAVGITANVFRFLYAPIIDATLTVPRWYLIGLVSCVGMTIALSTTALVREAAGTVTAMVFLCQVSTTLVMNPIGALMATTVEESMKGRAAGWCQAGNNGGQGLAGIAIWVSNHYSNAVAGATVATIMGACALGLLFVAEPVQQAAGAWMRRLQTLGRDLLVMARNPTSVLIMALILTPIGVGAATAIWPAVAAEWGASADRVAFDTGILSAAAATAGAVIGGQIADRLGRWWAYFGSGVALAIFSVQVVLMARTPSTYDLGVIGYAFFTGMGTAAWCALVLVATGRTAVATTYAALASIGNLPNAYMTWIDGLIHDRNGVTAMFIAEAMITLVCVAFGLLALKRISSSTVKSHSDVELYRA